MKNILGHRIHCLSSLGQSWPRSPCVISYGWYCTKYTCLDKTTHILFHDIPKIVWIIHSFFWHMHYGCTPQDENLPIYEFQVIWLFWNSGHANSLTYFICFLSYLFWRGVSTLFSFLSIPNPLDDIMTFDLCLRICLKYYPIASLPICTQMTITASFWPIHFLRLLYIKKKSKNRMNAIL